jgi:hypothetical protein
MVGLISLLVPPQLCVHAGGRVTLLSPCFPFLARLQCCCRLLVLPFARDSVGPVDQYWPAEYHCIQSVLASCCVPCMRVETLHDIKLAGGAVRELPGCHHGVQRCNMTRQSLLRHPRRYGRELGKLMATIYPSIARVSLPVASSADQRTKFYV